MKFERAVRLAIVELSDHKQEFAVAYLALMLRVQQMMGEKAEGKGLFKPCFDGMLSRAIRETGATQTQEEK